MEYQMSDSQILKNYYSTIYESTEYKDYVMAEKRCSHQNDRVSKLYNTVEFLGMLLVASIYSSIFFVIKYNYKLFPLVIPFAFFLYIVNSGTYKKENKISEKSYEALREKEQLFKNLVERTEKPRMPEDKLTPEFIKTIIAVFDSGRADTFKEALQIHEQDCQFQKLKAQQDSLIYAANNARMEAEKAQKAAAQAKKAAENQRRETEYRRQEAEYWRRENEYWNNH